MPLYHDIDCRDGKEKEANSGMKEIIIHTGVAGKVKEKQKRHMSHKGHRKVVLTKEKVKTEKLTILMNKPLTFFQLINVSINFILKKAYFS